MQIVALATFLADVEKRAQATGVADIPVDALRNKGAGRTARKRDLLARAAEHDSDAGTIVKSYF
jgi:hypothetical protein